METETDIFSRFQIDLDAGENAVFTSGDLITGWLLIELRKPMNTEVNIRLKGNAVWLNGSLKMGRSEKHYVDQELFLTRLDDPEPGPSQWMANHLYSRSFEFQLPESCPDTYEGPYGFVRYLLCASVAQVDESDKIKEYYVKKAFTVVSPSQGYIATGKPTQAKDSVYIGNWFSKKLVAELSLTKQKFMPGENIYGNLKIGNGQPKDVLNHVRARLVDRVRRTGAPKTSAASEWRTLLVRNLETHHETSNKGKRVIEQSGLFLLTVPPVCPSTTGRHKDRSNNSFLKIEYAIHVSIGTELLEIPIEIGKLSITDKTNTLKSTITGPEDLEEAEDMEKIAVNGPFLYTPMYPYPKNDETDGTSTRSLISNSNSETMDKNMAEDKSPIRDKTDTLKSRWGSVENLENGSFLNTPFYSYPIFDEADGEDNICETNNTHSGVYSDLVEDTNVTTIQTSDTLAGDVESETTMEDTVVEDEQFVLHPIWETTLSDEKGEKVANGTGEVNTGVLKTIMEVSDSIELLELEEQHNETSFPTAAEHIEPTIETFTNKNGDTSKTIIGSDDDNTCVKAFNKSMMGRDEFPETVELVEDKEQHNEASLPTAAQPTIETFTNKNGETTRTIMGSNNDNTCVEAFNKGVMGRDEFPETVKLVEDKEQHNEASFQPAAEQIEQTIETFTNENGETSKTSIVSDDNEFMEASNKSVIERDEFPETVELVEDEQQHNDTNASTAHNSADIYVSRTTDKDATEEKKEVVRSDEQLVKGTDGTEKITVKGPFVNTPCTVNDSDELKNIMSMIADTYRNVNLDLSEKTEISSFQTINTDVDSSVSTTIEETISENKNTITHSFLETTVKSTKTRRVITTTKTYIVPGDKRSVTGRNEFPKIVELVKSEEEQSGESDPTTAKPASEASIDENLKETVVSTETVEDGKSKIVKTTILTKHGNEETMVQEQHTENVSPTHE